MFCPAILPMVLALSSCSTRRREPRAGLGKLATSPAAYTSGWPERQNSSTTMPFSTSTPACSAGSRRHRHRPGDESPRRGAHDALAAARLQPGHPFARAHLDAFLPIVIDEEAR